MDCITTSYQFSFDEVNDERRFHSYWGMKIHKIEPNEKNYHFTSHEARCVKLKLDDGVEGAYCISSSIASVLIGWDSTYS